MFYGRGSSNALHAELSEAARAAFDGAAGASGDLADVAEGASDDGGGSLSGASSDDGAGGLPPVAALGSDAAAPRRRCAPRLVFSKKGYDDKTPTHTSSQFRVWCRLLRRSDWQLVNRTATTISKAASERRRALSCQHTPALSCQSTRACHAETPEQPSRRCYSWLVPWHWRCLTNCS